jgi:hypothetical protein
MSTTHHIGWSDMGWDPDNFCSDTDMSVHMNTLKVQRVKVR